MKKPNRIAVFLGHPAHFHMFKHMVASLEQQGIEVDYVIKRKDIVEDLVKISGHNYYVIRNEERKYSTKWSLAWSLIAMETNMIRYLLHRHPRLVIGTYAPVLSHLLGIPYIVCCEDDTSVVPRFARTSYPYANAILTPLYCDGGKWDEKMTKYAGFQKLAYLHPNVFTPNPILVIPYLKNPDRPFALIRFAKLQAHHDDHIGGISNDTALHIINKLSSTHDIYISSERPLDPQLEYYRLNINPMHIHHWLAMADLFIGDSQSMAVEAAMLGTPSIRFSDFARRIGVLNVLEERYHLTTGIPTHRPDMLYNSIDQMLNTSNLKLLYQERRSKMLEEQIDVSQFFTNYVLHHTCMTSR